LRAKQKPQQEQQQNMAIFHLHAQVIKRSEGRSSVAAAAYRLGVALEDPRTGLRHDFSRKGGVSGSLTLAPDNAPAWASDPAQLWANVET
ncbi:MobA/MobL family protein, partial [Acinetobacter baumannii]|uniref:MobA/MobL family protein n=1 Tax=Acinetobacter baumannii TaxID=470 RepID=UPI001C09E9F4